MNSRLWRVAGGLALAHVIVAFAGAALEKSPELGATASTRKAAFVHSSLNTVLAGGYIDYLGELAFLGSALLLAQLLRGPGVLSHRTAAISGARSPWPYRPVSCSASLPTSVSEPVPHSLRRTGGAPGGSRIPSPLWKDPR
jgi:hypothetical protein